MAPPAGETSRTLLVEISGTAVGALRLMRNDNAAGIYGFAVDPARQGVASDATFYAVSVTNYARRICHPLRQEGLSPTTSGGVHRIGLESRSTTTTQLACTHPWDGSTTLIQG